MACNEKHIKRVKMNITQTIAAIATSHGIGGIGIIRISGKR